MNEQSSACAGRPYRESKGKPLPLGASVTREGVNFSIFSKHAEKVTLALYEAGAPHPFAEIPLDPGLNRTGEIWHVLLCGLDHHGVEYVYRMDGPWDPANGHRFDPGVSLIDPYARALAGAETWAAQYVRVSYDGKTNTDSDVRCKIIDDGFDWRGDRHPNIPMEDLIIYELHVRGFTRSPSSGVTSPGTFDGLVEKLPYLKALGINAVELMPVHEFFESEIERSDPTTGARLVNYWGYSTMAFFAPKASYAAAGGRGGQINEFKELVRRCHEEGIEVILDVVFNHTAEGDARGPTLSFRGIDNQTYYMLDPGGAYFNFSGCGNTMNCNHPVVREMIRECLRYWVMETHVDGFRFDLASILGRDMNGEPLSNPPLIESLTLDPVLAERKLIAEAWDAGGLYQIGSFCAGGRWGEWNGWYRDAARHFLAGDPGEVAELAKRISGSPDLYEEGGRYPYHSINFITCHDGFTLADLFSYNEKHNEANGEDNRDGTDANWSHNHGAEGPADDPAIRAVRRRQVKNAVVLLTLSQGVPMFYEGDEMGRSKRGNNNTYCHDTELNWIDWNLLEKNAGLHRFVKGMIHLRKRYPALRRKTFYTGEPLPGTDVRDVEWHGTRRGEPDWSKDAQTLAFMIGGPHEHNGRRAPDIYAAFNTRNEAAGFELPQVPGRVWRRVVDTALDAPGDFLEPGHEAKLAGQERVELAPRSSVVLICCDT